MIDDDDDDDDPFDNPYLPCPRRCDPHQPGMGWPLMKGIRSKTGQPCLWCENCNNSFEPSVIFGGSE